MPNFVDKLQTITAENKHNNSVSKCVVRDNDIVRKYNLYKEELVNSILQQIRKHCIEKAEQGKSQLFQEIKRDVQDIDDFMFCYGKDSGSLFTSVDSFYGDIKDIVVKELKQEGFRYVSCEVGHGPDWRFSGNNVVVFKFIIEW